MSTKIYIDWQDDDFTWDSEIREWENVYIIIEELVGGGGARDPQYWGDYPFSEQKPKEDNDQQINEIRHEIEKNLEKLNDSKKQKLIEVLVTIDGEKYKETKSKNIKDIKISVKDIETIAKNYLNIEITDI